MKILHVRNIANVAGTLARQQRKMGHDSKVLCINKARYGMEGDINLDLPHDYTLADLPGRGVRLTRAMLDAKDYDIFHLHTGGAFPYDLDIPFWYKVAGKAVVHWHGTKLRRGKTFGGIFADKTFVCTPDLLRYDPEAVWIPNPVDLDALPKTLSRDDGRMRIVHVPTSRRYKGTGHVTKAVEELLDEGYDIDFRLVENVSHIAALKEIAAADIIVDQLLLGWYGVVGVEGMALQKPVCVFVKNNLLKYAPGLPVINSNPDTIKKELAFLIEDENTRNDLGLKGRRFVERIHDVRKVAERVDSQYRLM